MFVVRVMEDNAVFLSPFTKSVVFHRCMVIP